MALVALAAGGWTFWDSGVKPNLFPKNFGVVEAGKIYRSGELTPGAFEKIRDEHHIRTIVDLGTHEPGSAAERREARTAEALGLTRFVFDLEGDATGNPNQYVQALEIMTDPAHQPVLVHCGAGSERTGCAVALYRSLTRGTPILEAYEEAKQFRHDPARNPHLREVLERYGQPILDAYRAKTPIARVPPWPAPEGQRPSATKTPP